MEGFDSSNDPLLRKSDQLANGNSSNHASLGFFPAFPGYEHPN
jgi:hypothetical protein